MSIAQIVLWPDDRARLFAPVTHLRGALRTGDPTLAPPAASPPPAPDTLGAMRSDRIGPLRRTSNVETIGWLLGGAAILLVVFVVAVPLVLSGSMPQLAAIFVAACLPPAVVLLLLAWRYARPIYVRVDDQGLRWRGPAGRLYRLLWQDADSFFTLTYPRLTFPWLWRIDNDTVYGLAAESSGLAWRADSGAPAQDGRLSPSAALLQLIRERTGLPLRDVSVEAKRIGEAANPIQVTVMDGKLQITRKSSASPRHTTAHIFRVVGLAHSPFLLLSAISLVAMLVQAPYYEHLYAQSHSHQPLYADPLTHADGDWPTTPFASFTGGAYHFAYQGSSGVSEMYVPAPRADDSAVYEVTARIGLGSNVLGIGLGVAREGESFPELTFLVDYDGGWDISYWRPAAASADQYFSSGSSGEIHKGFGAANRIAVLVRGAEYTFFINGHYVAGYQNNALIDSRIGLFLESVSNPGDFNDFAIYPLG